MKKLIIALLLFIIGTGTNTLQASHPGKHSGIKGEQIKQHKRIRHGVVNGELTHKEATRLRTQQMKIRHDKRIAKADGVVTPAERAHIKHEQNRAGRNIYRQKHDAQGR